MTALPNNVNQIKMTSRDNEMDNIIVDQQYGIYHDAFSTTYTSSFKLKPDTIPYLDYHFPLTKNIIYSCQCGISFYD